jgi:prepilin-type N-terminal cleavage/methylation domain-containing protein
LSQQRGFTLIETMIVVVIVGLVLAIGMPGFTAYRNDMKLRQARAQLNEDLRLARQIAVTRRAPVYIRFGTPPSTTDISTYQIHIDTNGNGLVDAGERAWIRTLPSSTKLSSVGLTPTDTLAFDISGILVQPNGGSTPGGILIFKNAKSRYDTLAVSTAGIIYRP